MLLRQLHYGIALVSVVSLSAESSIQSQQGAKPTPSVKLEKPVDRARAALKAQVPAVPNEQKIVGGKDVVAGRFPFQVALIAVETPVGSEHFGQFCGGALIASNWVLTAAHCVPDTTKDEVDVYIGSVILPSGPGTPAGTGSRRHLDLIRPHPSYVPKTSDNDIALLKLSEPAPPNLTPAVIATPALEKLLGVEGKKVTVIGWGRTSEGSKTSPTLKEVEVTVQSAQVCERNYREVVPASEITQNMFCGGEVQGGKDSCQGDSGGFIGAQSQQAWVELGIVSWGIGCAQPKLFGVYTRVANFGSWIATTMKNN